jgi:hypothetical protein
LSVYFKQNVTNCSFSTSESWVILSPIEQRIKAKIEAVGMPLKDWNINIYRGILTGYNEAFIINGKKKEELIAKDPKSEEIIRPILRGRDIKRYGCDFADLWLINIHNGIKEKGIKPININDYQAIKNWLDFGGIAYNGKIYEGYKQIEKRADQGDTPYNLRNCAYMDDFYKQKIIFQEMVQEPSFMFDKAGTFFCLDTGRIITGRDIKFLLPILNSKLFFFAIKYFYGGGGLGDSGVRMKHTFFEKFCCPILDLKIKHQLEQLLQMKNYQEIDNLIYRFYDLSAEEINIIDSQ